VLDTDNVNGAAGSRDAYVRSLVDDTTHMVSLTTGDARGSGVDAGTPPAIDHTGARVAFVTWNALSTRDDSGSFDAYVRNQVGGAGENTQLVSAGPDTADAVALSGSSTRLAYTNRHVWLATCALACGTPIRADAEPGGATGPFFPRRLENGVPQDPIALYWRTPAPLDPADTDQAIDLYGRDVASLPGGQIFQIPTADGDVTGADVGGLTVVFGMQRTSSLPGSDGTTRQVWLVTPGGVANLSQPLGAPPRLNGAGTARLGRRHATSADGRTVVFGSAAPALGSPLRGDGYADQIVARDVVSGANTLVSVAPDGVTPANDASFNASVDASGRRVAFASVATNLVPGVTDVEVHVYVRDLATGATTLLDRTASGAPAGADSEPQISANGATVVFSSRDPDLPGAPGDGNSHVYRADLASGSLVLVDRSSTGEVANRGADHPDVSADGNRVAFSSTSTNLGGATAPKDDVYVRDLATGTTIWASPDAGSSARDPSISADGRRVAFTQEREQEQILVRDLAARTTTLASTGPAGPADTGAVDSSISGDGTKVTFISGARNLGGPVDRFRTAYVRDLTTGTTSVVAQGRSSEDGAVLSANGACVALQSGSDDLVAGYGPDFQHVFLHALGPGCAETATAAGANRTAPRKIRRRCAGRRATIVGTRGRDRLRGTRRADVIVALGGHDRVRAGRGRDLVCGGRGNDRLFGGPGRDRLIGGPGRDRTKQ
jgi:Tol biopolymer transport system component